MSFLATIGSALMPTVLETIGNVGRTAVNTLGGWAMNKLSAKTEQLTNPDYDARFRRIIETM